MTGRRPAWRLSPSLVTARPRLSAAAAVGLLVGAAALLAAGSSLSTGLILGWDAFCLSFLALTLTMMAREGPPEIAARAAAQDEGRGVILLLITLVTAASLAAVAAELIRVKDASPLTHTVHAALAVATVIASWMVMQTVLALHYAHEFYADDDGDGRMHGGLAFPGGDPPTYWDFLHFAIVIGVAAQTADIAITDPKLRRLATAHSLLAFLFNTLIVALTINLVSGLF